MRQERAGRVPPHRDEKVIVSWNGLMIAALAAGAQVLGDRRYYEAAAKAARFILQEMLQENFLWRIWTAGQVSVPGSPRITPSWPMACWSFMRRILIPAG